MDKISAFHILDLTLSGFKSYNEATTFTFGNPTIITGGNGRGKSSIADAIAFAITGLPFFGERSIDRLHCDDNQDLHISLRFMTEDGNVHILNRSRRKSRMFITLDGEDTTQSTLFQLFGEKEVVLSILNPLYFIEELGNNGKDLLRRYLPTIPHEQIMAELNQQTQKVLSEVEFNSPESYLKTLREEIRTSEESIIYLTGQKDLSNQQADSLGNSQAEKKQLLEHLSQEIATLEVMQFEGLDLQALHQQVVDLSQRYNEAVKDGGGNGTALLHSEINHLRQRMTQRQSEVYVSQFTDSLAQTQLLVQQLGQQYHKEVSLAKELASGSPCPTCHRSITEESLSQVQETFQGVLGQIMAQGQERRRQLLEIQEMDNKSKAAFHEFQRQDVTAMEDEILRLQQQIAQLEDQTDTNLLEQLRGQIQSITATLDYGNLSVQDYQRLEELRNQRQQLQSELTAMDHMVQQSIPDFDGQMKAANDTIKAKKGLIADIALYLSKKAELTFASLRLNRVAISLYDVVKTTGEVKDTFRFTYNGRRYDRLSLSEKIRAGMEVSELVKKLTGRNYPVFIDNMESVEDLANVRPTGQIIMAKCIPHAMLNVQGSQPTQSQSMAA